MGTSPGGAKDKLRQESVGMTKVLAQQNRQPRPFRWKRKDLRPLQINGAIEGTRTPTPLRVHGPEPCASANSATMASGLTLQRRPSRPPYQEDLQLYSTDTRPRVNPQGSRSPEAASPPYSSFALIVIFAFSTFDTGHPFSAASAYFWKVAASAPGTLLTTSMWLAGM